MAHPRSWAPVRCCVRSCNARSRLSGQRQFRCAAHCRQGRKSQDLPDCSLALVCWSATVHPCVRKIPSNSERGDDRCCCPAFRKPISISAGISRNSEPYLRALLSADRHPKPDTNGLFRQYRRRCRLERHPPDNGCEHTPGHSELHDLSVRSPRSQNAEQNRAGTQTPRLRLVSTRRNTPARRRKKGTEAASSAPATIDILERQSLSLSHPNLTFRMVGSESERGVE